MMNKQPILWSGQQMHQAFKLLTANPDSESIVFAGQVDAGRSIFLRLMVAQLLCEQSHHEPCGQCNHCQLLAVDNHPDLLWLDVEAGSAMIKIDAVRNMVAFMQKTPAVAPIKVAVVASAEHLNSASANALLKTFEAPVGGAKILLGAAHPDAVLPTLRSRCRTIYLPKSDQMQAVAWLAEQGQMDDNVASQWLLLASALPLRALRYQSDPNLQVLINHLFNWPLTPGIAWRTVLSECALTDVIELMQVLLHDALLHCYMGRPSVWGEIYQQWLQQIQNIADRRRIAHAQSCCLQLRSMLAGQVTLNQAACLQQLGDIWNGIWSKKEGLC